MRLREIPKLLPNLEEELIISSSLCVILQLAPCVKLSTLTAAGTLLLELEPTSLKHKWYETTVL